MISKKMQDNANLALWGVHVVGTDEIHAANSYQEAVEISAIMNDAFDAHIGDGVNDKLLFATPVVWSVRDEDPQKGITQREEDMAQEGEA